MTRINYLSDFDFLLSLKGCHVGDESRHGEPTFPPYPFHGFVSSGSSDEKYEFSWDGSAGVNCAREEELVHIVCDGHGLPPGKLRLELFLELPDILYPDGSKALHSVHDTGIELVRGNGDCYDEPAQVELVVNWALVTAYDIAVQKGGYTGTMEDFYVALSAIPNAARVLEEARDAADRASEIADSIELLRPILKTEQEMEQMIANGTCVDGQIYYTVEED